MKRLLLRLFRDPIRDFAAALVHDLFVEAREWVDGVPGPDGAESPIERELLPSEEEIALRLLDALEARALAALDDALGAK